MDVNGHVFLAATVKEIDRQGNKVFRNFQWSKMLQWQYLFVGGFSEAKIPEKRGEKSLLRENIRVKIEIACVPPPPLLPEVRSLLDCEQIGGLILSSEAI